MTWTQGFFAVGYFFFFIVCALALVWWQRRQRKTRKPFGDDTRLLRTAGETQLKIFSKFEEDFALWLGTAAGVPALIVGTMLPLTLKMPDILQWAWLGLTVLVFIGSFYVAVRWFAKKTEEMSNRYLGYFGERIVAEHLEPLKGQGWRILHDVPFQNNGTKFNLDHIAIGPQGVFAIETKTRRKGNARPGFDDHRVFFDGRDLEWPWGNDNHGLEQAERNAMELTKVIKAETDERVHVTPILTLPGWFVEPRPSRATRMCRVTNPKGLTKFLPSGPAVLDAAKIAAIATKLEARCRDVEY
ncbi:Nuclease-related domain protein [Lacunisphaera limnophila]|uniref:Nuclease-related domain protein n=1 Tax=Lacunisphaera limnophila TaxID=1838286 RepID=A0A1D8AX45_9BACT|nr:nuclease-related domain-containing protein [Lacunisphaera limnophila]AOS45462.1 Nuclease-related domain protein [Lacunisphaera limnophila]